MASACKSLLRLSARRLLSNSSSVTSSSSSSGSSMSGVMVAWEEALSKRKSKVSWKQYFESDYFWNEANVGPFFLFLFAAPYLYGGLKTIYSTFKYRRLNEQEILSDRFTWLHERFLEDEVESVLLQQVPPGGFDKSRPGLLLGPSIV